VRDIITDLDVTVLSNGDTDRRVKEVIVGVQAAPGVLPLLREGRLCRTSGATCERTKGLSIPTHRPCSSRSEAGSMITGPVRTGPGNQDLRRSAMALISSGRSLSNTDTTASTVVTAAHPMDVDDVTSAVRIALGWGFLGRAERQDAR
jgi:phosphate acetyltransferase